MSDRELLALERWRQKLEAAGFRVSYASSPDPVVPPALPPVLDPVSPARRYV